MAKKDLSNSITKITPANVPAFMQGTENLGTELLKQFVIPPRIKIVQKQSDDALLQLFGPGDVILSPMNALVSELPRDPKGRPMDGATVSFLIVPVFFYPEWVTWNPIQLKGKSPAVVYRTTDPSDPVALKSKNQDLRYEPIPGEPDATLRRRHVEHLNFVVILYKSDVTREPCVLSFSRGEHGSGTKFAGLVQMRKAPIYGCVFNASVSMRHGSKGDWYGFDITNPDGDGAGWVTEDEYRAFGKLHVQYAQYHKEHRLQATLEDEETEANNNASPDGKREF